MSRNVRRIGRSPEEVFAVLSDGWLYTGWVVGAARMRAVEDAWPARGARLHHSFGSWPLFINDTTEVEEIIEDRRLVIRARGWPLGEARVQIDVRETTGGCVVHLEEAPVSGPGVWLRGAIEPLLFLRNRETLRRLAHLVEGGAARRTE